MSFWSGEKLRERLSKDDLVSPFNDKAIDCAAYALTLGGCAFTSGDDETREKAFHRGETPGIIKLPERGTVTIRPGQFAFLLTEERVTIPKDAVGFISVKATHKFEGLINVSGFHVDPGWSSPLIFGVFNAGAKELVFERGQKLFLLFLADLDQGTQELYRPKGSYPYDHIPAALVQNMAGNIPSIYKLSKTSRDLEGSIKSLQAQADKANNTATLAFGLVLLLVAKAFGGSLLATEDGGVTPAAPSPSPAQLKQAPTPASDAPAQPAGAQQGPKKDKKSGSGKPPP